jgi:hypothetical protein
MYSENVISSISFSTDQHVSTTKSLKPILKTSKNRKSIVSIQSSTELLENLTTENEKFYDETFESDVDLPTTRSSFRKTCMSSRSRTKSSENSSFNSSFPYEKDYSQSFEITTKSSSSEIHTASSLDSSDSERVRLAELKKENYVQFLKEKLKIISQKEDEKYSLEVRKNQIDKFISRIRKNDLVRNIIQKTEDKEKEHRQAKREAKNSQFKINPELVNKIEALNTVNRVRNELFDKIENEFGADILSSAQNLNIDDMNKLYERKNQARNKELYLRLKTSQIQSRLTEKHYTEHEIIYCDSLMLIADLARNLPKHSDPPELIWNKLLEPIKLKN